MVKKLFVFTTLVIFFSFSLAVLAHDVSESAQRSVSQTRTEAREARQGAREIRQEARELRREAKEELLGNAREKIREARRIKREEFRSRVGEMREEARNRIENHREKLQERLKNRVKDERKKEAVERINDSMVRLNDRMVGHFSDILDQIERVLERIGERADRAEERGVDVFAVRTAIDEAYEAISKARGQVEVRAGKVYEVNITTEDNLRTDVGKARRALHDDLVQVRDLVKVARDAVREAAVVLGQASEPNESPTDQ